MNIYITKNIKQKHKLPQFFSVLLFVEIKKIQEWCVTLSYVLQVSISSCHSWKEQCKGIRRYRTTPVTRDVVVLNRESINYGKTLFSTEAQFMASQKFLKHKETEQGNLKSRLSMIVWVNVVLNRTVVVDSDWRFDNLCRSHLQSQSESYHVSWWYYTLVIDLIGQLSRDVIGRLSVKR